MRVLTIDILKIELPPGVPRSPKKVSPIVFDPRNSDPELELLPVPFEASRSRPSDLTSPETRNPRGTTAKPLSRAKKANFEKPTIAAEENPDETRQAASSNQIETSSKKSVIRVVSNTVSQDDETGQGKDEQEDEKDVGGIRMNHREEITPRSAPFRSRQACSSHHQILVWISFSVCQFFKQLILT